MQPSAKTYQFQQSGKRFGGCFSDNSKKTNLLILWANFFKINKHRIKCHNEKLFQISATFLKEIDYLSLTIKKFMW